MRAAAAPGRYAALPSHIPAVAACSYPVREGNSVRALVDGAPAFRRICEAVEAARRSVWVTVAYLDPAFVMPDGRGSLFDVLDAAAARGLDVRAIFWRTEECGPGGRPVAFFGSDEDHARLAARPARFRARWDRAQKHYCQHQKSWLIDAGTGNDVAFIGGINLDSASVSPPGHAGDGRAHIHDVYLELCGPAAADVHHNFVQRWNEASERGRAGGEWPREGNDDLAFPSSVPPPAGNTIVQIQRTVRAGHYTNAVPAPSGAAFPISDGETSIFRQYAAAIDAAREYIYIEDQYIASPDIVEGLHRAAARGIEIAYLVPADPEPKVKEARRRPAARQFFDRLAALGAHGNFTLAGIAPAHDRPPVYVHAKIAVIDDCWATIGSCNIASQSFFCDTELNAAIWDGEFARAFRAELLHEHLGAATNGMSGREAMSLFRSTARANAAARAAARPMRGLAYALDPAAYGA